MTFDTDPIDKYGRRLGYIWVGDCDLLDIQETPDCILINLQMIQEGLAYVYRRASFAWFEVFDEYEKQAKRDKIRIWSNNQLRSSIHQVQTEQERRKEVEDIQEMYEQMFQEQLQQVQADE